MSFFQRMTTTLSRIRERALGLVRLWKATDTSREILPPYALNYFDFLGEVYRTLPHDLGDPAIRAAIDAVLSPPGHVKPTWNDLFVLDANLLKVTPNEQIRLQASGRRAQLRTILGAEQFDVLTSGVLPASGNDPQALRDQLTFIVGEIHKAYVMTAARESFRSRMLVKVGLVTGVYIGLLFLFWLSLFISEVTHPRFGEVLNTAFAAAVLGSIGGYISLQSRLQALPYEGDTVFRLLALDKGWLGVYMSPVNGSIFAILAYMLFSAQLIKGDLLPEFQHYTEDDLKGLHKSIQGMQRIQLITMHDMYDYPKLFIWSFLVGFAERYVPDVLDRLIRKREEAIVGPVGPASVASTTRLANVPAGNGTSGPKG